jgi:sugar transferase EpsL
MMYRSFGKRLTDLVLSLVLLVICSPVFILIAVLLLLCGTDPFFVQERPGLKGRIFRLIKFRTMRNLYDQDGVLLPDQLRITGVGRFLRSTSLDELPQLLNVCKGEMSLIGPRPLLPEYLSLYTPEQARRHDVLPGITGWSQINGRNAISWEEKFKLDVWYVDHYSLKLDLKIIILTFWKVLRRTGINTASGTAMDTFKGSQL